MNSFSVSQFFFFFVVVAVELSYLRSTVLITRLPAQFVFIGTRRILYILYSAQHGSQHKDAFA